MILETAALISIGSWLGSKIADKGFDSIYSKLTKSDEINDKFYKAVKNTSQKLQTKYPSILGGSIEYFFKKEDVFSELVKLLFKSSAVDEEIIAASFDVNHLPEDFILEFISDLKKELEKDRTISEILANKEIFITIQGLGQNVENISKSSNLTQMEVTKIRNLLEQRINETFAFDDFIETYSKNALNNLSQVNFIGLGVDISIKRKRKNLQDVFVRPYFMVDNKNSKKKQVKIGDVDLPPEAPELSSYFNLFNYSTKLVILGNPGSGKSVLVKSIICDILSKSESAFNDSEVLGTIPFRIELRKYLSFKKSKRGNIIKYLSALLEEEYSIHNTTDSILNNILKKKNAFFFFDGLDEIFKVEDKIDIKNDIENFHNLFPNIRSLTTSRIIGYEEAKLQEEQFCEFNILDFNDEQVKEYLERWYEKEEENAEIRQREISGFLSKKHEIDKELVSNPLLLSLIVILYRNILKLPESKLEIYQSCTKTLVDKWDASKDLIIDLELDIYKNKEKILADLAYWQYEQLSGESVVITYEKARNTVASTLKERLKIADDDNSDDLAERFMSYAQKRSIYFDNNFTHKTFLEYYTAYWIYSNIEKKHNIERRNIIISTYIDNSFWHIVLELLLNMIDKDQADSEIMDELIVKQIHQKTTSLPFILATITSFKNISKSSLSTLINSSIDVLLKTAKLKKSKNFIHEQESLEIQIFEGLQRLYHTEPNAKVLVIERLRNNEAELPTLAVLNYALYLELEYIVNHEERHRSFELNNKVLFENSIKASPYLYVLSTYYFSQDNEGSYLESIENFINYFSVKKLFEDTEAIFDSFIFGPFITFYLDNQIQKSNIAEMTTNLSNLESKGLHIKNIIDFLSKGKTYFRFTEETLESIIDRIDIEDNKSIVQLLLITLFQGLEYSYVRNKRNNLNFYKMVDSSMNKKLLQQIYEKEGLLNKIKAIKSL